MTLGINIKFYKMAQSRVKKEKEKKRSKAQVWTNGNHSVRNLIETQRGPE